MHTTSRRVKAALIGAGALAAFGMIIPAQAAKPDKGANQACGSYCSTKDQGQPSGNGNGNGNATGRPAAGEVGNADDKNPPGQSAGPESDGNSGYECDNNNGVGKGNPAHSGCEGQGGSNTAGAGSGGNAAGAGSGAGVYGSGAGA